MTSVPFDVVEEILSPKFCKTGTFLSQTTLNVRDQRWELSHNECRKVSSRACTVLGHLFSKHEILSYGVCSQFLAQFYACDQERAHRTRKPRYKNKRSTLVHMGLHFLMPSWPDLLES